MPSKDTTPNIRPMCPSDYDSVFTLWHHTTGMGLRHLDDSREGITKFLNRNPSTCFVAENDMGIFGVILSGYDGRRGYIYHMAVDDSYRKQGIGRLLLQHAEEALKNEGIHKVALVVFATNAIGNAFWEREGYVLRDDLCYRNKSLNEYNL